MEVKTIAELSKHQNINGIKDCTGIVNMAEIVANTPDDFLAFTGEDADALAARNVGAQGVISVASHLFGKEISQMYAANSKGDNEIAGELMRDLTPIMSESKSADAVCRFLRLMMLRHQFYSISWEFEKSRWKNE